MTKPTKISTTDLMRLVGWGQACLAEPKTGKPLFALSLLTLDTEDKERRDNYFGNKEQLDLMITDLQNIRLEMDRM